MEISAEIVGELCVCVCTYWYLCVCTYWYLSVHVYDAYVCMYVSVCMCICTVYTIL